MTEVKTTDNKNILDQLILSYTQQLDMYISLQDLFLTSTATFDYRKNAEDALKNHPSEDFNKILLHKAFENLIKTAVFSFPDIARALKSRVKTSLTVFDPEKFVHHPYMENIKIQASSSDNYVLNTASYRPFELFLYETNDPDKFDLLHLGCFPTPVNIPVISSSKDGYAEGITPREFFEAGKIASRVSGRVLVIDGGLGFLPFLLCQNPRVTDIHVLFSNPNLLSLFIGKILPQFPVPGKINLMYTNPNLFLSSMMDGEYDYCIYNTCKDFHFDTKKMIIYTTKKEDQENLREYPFPADITVKDNSFADFEKYIEFSTIAAKYQRTKVLCMDSNLYKLKKRIIFLAAQKAIKGTSSFPIDYWSVFFMKNFKNIDFESAEEIKTFFNTTPFFKF